MCTANICRSPYLELRARQLLGDDPSVVFSSAGTHGFVDSPVSDTMAAEFADRDLDSGEFRSRKLTRALVDEADLILTAEASHRTFILDEQPQAFRKVLTLGQFVATLETTDGSLRGHELVEALQGRRVAASPGHDIGDPYRRGREMARSSARIMDDLVVPVVDALRSRPKTLVTY